MTSGTGGPLRIAVVGAGITGLAAAHELLRRGHRPVVFESSAATGGKLQGSAFAGFDHVDEAADMFLTRVPWARDLATELGLGDDLVAPATGVAFVWRHHRFHPLPEGLVLGVPTGIGSLLRSRLISVRGAARAGLDLVRPATPADHDNLGRLVADRFGDEILDQLVDPMIGGINAGDARRLSLAAAAPQIAKAACGRRSLLLALRAQRARASAGGPVFLAPSGGMSALARTATESVVAAGGTVHLRAPVALVRPDGARVVVELAPGPDTPAAAAADAAAPFDGAVVAVPAFVAAPLLDGWAPGAGEQLRAVPHAGVVLVSALVDRGTAARLPSGSGYLVPKPQQHELTAVSFTSRKWPRLLPGDGSEIVRISLGRFSNDRIVDADDDEVLATAEREMATHLGALPTFLATRISRWPRGFPQYLPHHERLVADVSADVAAASGGRVVLAGAAYHGLGVPACIRDGRNGSAALVRLLAGLPN
jgi:oxygen-dependent protoporphyrinogen oxidase